MKQKVTMYFLEINLNMCKNRLYNTIILRIMKFICQTHHLMDVSVSARH